MESFNTLIQFSVVYTAKSNNPTILNPDFLKFNEIVEKGWELKSPPICTEPFARVQFKNDVMITSQLDKIIFNIDKNPLEYEDRKIIHDIAIKYLNLVPLVNYNSIGINANLLICTPDGTEPPKYLIDHFFKRKLDGTNISVEDLQLKFRIPFDDKSQCNLDFIPLATKEDQNKKENGNIMVVSNFHHTVDEEKEEKIEFMKNIVDNYESDIRKLTNEILPFFFGE